MVDRSDSPIARMRARSAAALFVVYTGLAVSFWAAGVLAYWHGARGAARLLGLAYLPSLALPLVGRGRLAGIPVGSVVWWWWFAAQVVVAGVAIWLYPYDRPSNVPRLAAPRRHPVSTH